MKLSIEVNFDKSVYNKIYEKNKQEEFGARPIKRIIQNLLEDYLSEEILKGNITETISVNLKWKDDKIQLTKKKS